MLIIDKTRYNGEKSTNCTIQQVYEVLDKRDSIANADASNADSVQEIIAWLPSITDIDVYCYFENGFLDIHFVNGEIIRLYNTGVETALACLSEGLI